MNWPIVGGIAFILFLVFLIGPLLIAAVYAAFKGWQDIYRGDF